MRANPRSTPVRSYTRPLAVRSGGARTVTSRSGDTTPRGLDPTLIGIAPTQLVFHGEPIVYHDTPVYYAAGGLTP